MGEEGAEQSMSDEVVDRCIRCGCRIDSSVGCIIINGAVVCFNCKFKLDLKVPALVRLVWRVKNMIKELFKK